MDSGPAHHERLNAQVMGVARTTGGSETRPYARLAAPPGAGGAEGRARTKDGDLWQLPGAGCGVGPGWVRGGTGGSGAPEIGEEGLGEGRGERAG